MKNTVYIHTNEKQVVGAIVSKHSMFRNSANPDKFDVKLLMTKDFPLLGEYEGRKFLREGNTRVWVQDDLQSFTPLRFAPPEMQNYKGRAVVVDPDVFAIGDINELLERDMQGKAIMAKPRPGHNGREDYVASSVMLLDCEKLKHWNLASNFDELFAFKRDYDDWITLNCEDRSTIGYLESYWNDFDRLEADTKLIHNTKRRTQPWKAGLPIDFTIRVKWGLLGKLLGRNYARRKGNYLSHPDPRQEQLFFGYVRECLENGQLTEEMIAEEMRQNHVRHDALEVAQKAPNVDELLASVQQSQAA